MKFYYLLVELCYSFLFWVVDVIDWLAEKWPYVSVKDYDRVVEEREDLWDQVYEQEEEIRRLKLKCGESYEDADDF